MRYLLRRAGKAENSEPEKHRNEQQIIGAVRRPVDTGRTKRGRPDQPVGVARDAAKLPPKSLAVNKELMMRGTREELLKTNDIELELLRKQARGAESRDAIRGFAESQAQKKKETKAKL